MKTLILMRHAETESIFSANTDFERKLTPKGCKDAETAGSFFSSQLGEIDQVVHSSALRTTMTADIVCKKIKANTIRSTKDLYGASVLEWLKLVNQLEDRHSTILAIGHNPSVSYLVDYLTAAQRVSFSPGQAVCLTFEVDTWEAISQGLGNFQWYFDEV